MKKTALLLLLTGMLLAQAGIAAERKEPQNRQARRIEQLTKELSLTADQQAGVQAVMQASDDEIKGDPQKMRASRQAAHWQIMDLLTPEQAKKYEELRQPGPGMEMERRKQQRPAKRRARPEPAGRSAVTKPF